MLDESHSDLDSHADQCMLGDKTLVVNDFDKPVNIIGYDPKGPIMASL